MTENTATIETGTTVVFDGAEDVNGRIEVLTGTVTGYAKGWYTVEVPPCDSAINGFTAKKRAKDLEVLTDSTEDDEDVVRSQSATLARYKPNYTTTVTHTGAKSLSNGDAVAALLTAALPSDVARAADLLLREEPGFHAARYEGLNPGSVRMNSGNRIRGAFRRGEVTLEEIEAAMLGKAPAEAA